jgi:hypothetical protein
MSDNRDISNNQNNLFAVINRSYERDGVSGKAIQNGLRFNSYTELVNFRSDVNYPHQAYGQLDGNSVIGTFGKANSQSSKLTTPVINCTPRHNPEASRFNYAVDSQIDNRLIDVSGVEISNKFLRVMPNRGTHSAYQKPVMVSNPQIEKLVRDITNISSTPASTKNALKYKASRQRLTKAELIGAVEVKPAPIPRPVYPVAPPP